MTVATEDYAAIADHLARYCHAIDEGRTEEWLSLWADDGIFAVAGQPPAAGHEALSAIAARLQAGGTGKTRHMVSNLFCDYGEGRETVIASYYNFVTNWTNGARIVALIPSRATIVRRGDRWLVQRIDLTPLMG